MVLCYWTPVLTTETHTQVNVVLLISLSVIPLILTPKFGPYETESMLRCSEPALSAVDAQSTAQLAAQLLPRRRWSLLNHNVSSDTDNDGPR